MDTMNQEIAQQTSEENKDGSSSPQKTCAECYALSTPLWRSGPNGPKSLCNACGIKYNKKKREEEALALLEAARKQKRSSEVTEILEILLRDMAAGDDVIMEEKSEHLMSKLGEEERAAILLMNLSIGHAFAA